MRPLYWIASIGGAGANSGEEKIKENRNVDISEILHRTFENKRVHVLTDDERN
jgi:hypothetical protein